MNEALTPKQSSDFLKAVQESVNAKGLESQFNALMALYEFDLLTEASISSLYLVGLSVLIAQEAGNPSLLGATEEYMETLDIIAEVAERFLEKPQS